MNRPTAPAAEVVGRAEELNTVQAFVRSASPSSAAVLLIEGEAGIGKSTLWRYAVELARDQGDVVLTTRATELEVGFSYGSLIDLFAAVPTQALAELPPPQRRAIDVALLRAEPGREPVDPAATAVATLSILQAIAASRSVVVAVDDAQWLDPPSAAALRYAIRRFEGDRVRFVVVQRPIDPAADPLRLREVNAVRLALSGLTLAATSRLILEHHGVRLSRPLVRAIHETSAGNPFFALELARAIVPLGDDLDLARGLPMPVSLGALLSGRLADLPPRTRVALAAAAASKKPEIDVLAAAIGEPAVRTVLEPAIAAGVVRLDGGSVRFAHPLLAAAAYEDYSPSGRADLHRRLAEIATDAEERARHLAVSSADPDESVAALLEQAASRAYRRGAPGNAADLAWHARRLTPADRQAHGWRRAEAESEYATVAGDTARAVRVLEELIATTPSGPARARLISRRASVELWGLNWRSSIESYRAALGEAGGEERLRAEIELGLAGALDLLAEHPAEALRHARRATTLAQRSDDVTLVARGLSVQAKNRMRLTGRFPRRLMDRALALDPSLDPLAIERPIDYSVVLLSWTDDLQSTLRGYREILDASTSQADELSQAWTLLRLALVEWLTGDWHEALRHAHDGHDIALDAGQRANESLGLALRALVELHRGREEGAANAGLALSKAEESGARTAAIVARWAIGTHELALGRPRAAAAALAPLVEDVLAAGIREPGELRFVPDAIEALILADRPERAEPVLEFYEGCAARSRRPSAFAAASRCRGLLLAARRDLPGAVDELRTSVERWRPLGRPLELGRSLFLLGGMEQRAKRRATARRSLLDAARVFEELGAASWTARVAAELGATVRSTTGSSRLSPSEERVAALVAEGRTNREVAAALVLADRTIESHLTRIYDKLGVRSRAELAATYRPDERERERRSG